MNMQLSVGFITLDSSSDRHKYLQIICIALQFINMCCLSYLSPLQPIPPLETLQVTSLSLRLRNGSMCQCPSATSCMQRDATPNRTRTLSDCRLTGPASGFILRGISWRQHAEGNARQGLRRYLRVPYVPDGKQFTCFRYASVEVSLCLCGSVGVCVCVQVCVCVGKRIRLKVSVVSLRPR